ncbi:MAG: DUF2889 domain-containing protein [Novosphingobium sp.]
MLKPGEAKDWEKRAAIECWLSRGGKGDNLVYGRPLAGDYTMSTHLPPRLTANPSPVRRSGSIRRTSSIDVTWPDGAGQSRRLEGHARDLVTPLGGGAPVVRAAASMIAQVNKARMIEAISADPAPAGLQQLVGERGGGHLRMVLRERLPELLATASPLYLLLDDISGISLISRWAELLWSSDTAGGARAGEQALLREGRNEREGVCWGLQRGNSGLDISGATSLVVADGKELRNHLDPEGWHELPSTPGLSMRRARRIDVWREADCIRVEAAFQDSAPSPRGGRVALHEYTVRAALDPVTGVITALVPEPHVLPFHECPGAVANAMKLVGTPVGDMRDAVLANLRGAHGCTHLNDALRSMAEVPALLGYLDTLVPQPA